MRSPRQALALGVRGIQTLGLGCALQAALYPLRRTYHEARFSGHGSRGSSLRGLMGLFGPRRLPDLGPEVPRGWPHLGDVASRAHQGQTVTIGCQGGAAQVTVLAADLLRMRFSPSGQFFPPQSYVAARPDECWPPCAFTVTEGDEIIEVRTSRLVCRIHKRPCRFSFHDLQGALLHTDARPVAFGHREGRSELQAPVARCAVLASDEHVYGLGEKAFPLDRRGHRYSLWNSDPQNYGPGEDPLYLNVPFYVGLTQRYAYGLLYDNTYRAVLDAGQTSPDEVTYVTEQGELRYYFIYGPQMSCVLERYTELTGRLPLPPLWALGYHQSRWSYFPEARVREIAHLFRQHRIPCDALHLDIHYMDGYRCFTWNRERFPDPGGLLEDLHSAGFHTVVLIDCGIKAERHYPVCADGLAKGAFCTYPDGKVAGGPVWPGESYFPDFTNPEVREWWGQLHAPLLEMGVDGIWNDMNEPTVIGPRGDTLAGCVRHDWEGQGSDHRQAHNVYGMQTARATAEGLRRLCPERRPFVLTRAGWAGVQRYAACWTADNQSTWEHLRLTMSMVMGLGLSGLGLAGCDVGGFDRGADAEMLVRWTQMGAFLPFFRNHTSMWSCDQEPWVHGEPYLSLNRSAIELRYRLLPYLYTATWQCAERGWPIVRPLAWAYPYDESVHALDDQFLCGDALLVAPVCQPGATSRDVYLPEGGWLDFWTGERHEGPIALSVPAPLERIPLFVHAGTVLPTWPVQQHADPKRVTRVILHVYPGTGGSWLYEDDGESLAYQSGAYRLTRFDCRLEDKGCLVVVRDAQGPYRPSYSKWEWQVHSMDGAPAEVLADGQPATQSAYDDAARIVRVETDEVRRFELRGLAPPAAGNPCDDT